MTAARFCAVRGAPRAMWYRWRAAGGHGEGPVGRAGLRRCGGSTLGTPLSCRYVLAVSSLATVWKRWIVPFAANR